MYVGDDETSDVIADIDEGGAVVGIEILDVSIAADVTRARAFASGKGLQFPRDLAAAARDASAA